VVSDLSVLTQPTHLWRAWCKLGQSDMCQLKPRLNLRDLVKSAISSSLTHFASTLFTASRALLFSNQVRFYRALLSVTTTGCEISDGKACGNHSISCAHLAQHLYRCAGGFWKGEKSFTKSISETGLTQTVSGNTFNLFSLVSLHSVYFAHQQG